MGKHVEQGRKQANMGEKKDVHNLQLEVKTCKGANVKPLIGRQMQVVLSCVGGYRRYRRQEGGGGGDRMGGVGGPYTLCAPHFLLSALEEPLPRRLRPCLACGKLKLSHEIWTVSWTMTMRRRMPLTCPRRLSGRICPRLSGFSASPPPQPSCSQASSCPRREA